jgi:hypothetical protein
LTSPIPRAVVAAESGAEQWRAAVVEQRRAPLDHADFYAHAGEVVQTLRALEELARLLAQQVLGYQVGRRLYDDEGGDPADRLADAAADLAALRDHVDAAERDANAFWSAIGHVGEERSS